MVTTVQDVGNDDEDINTHTHTHTAVHTHTHYLLLLFALLFSLEQLVQWYSSLLYYNKINGSHGLMFG